MQQAYSRMYVFCIEKYELLHYDIMIIIIIPSYLISSVESAWAHTRRVRLYTQALTYNMAWHGWYTRGPTCEPIAQYLHNFHGEFLSLSFTLSLSLFGSFGFAAIFKFLADNVHTIYRAFVYVCAHEPHRIAQHRSLCDHTKPVNYNNIICIRRFFSLQRLLLKYIYSCMYCNRYVCVCVCVCAER